MHIHDIYHFTVNIMSLHSGWYHFFWLYRQLLNLTDARVSDFAAR